MPVPRLSIVGTRAVLAIEVAAQQRLLDVRRVGVQGERPLGHGSDGFKGDGVDHGPIGIGAPGEGAVGAHQHRRHAQGVVGSGHGWSR